MSHKRKSQLKRFIWILPVPSCQEEDILQLFDKSPVSNKSRIFKQPLSFYLSEAYLNPTTSQVVINCFKQINYTYLEDLFWPNLPQMSQFERKNPETIQQFLQHNQGFCQQIPLNKKPAHKMAIFQMILSLEDFLQKSKRLDSKVVSTTKKNLLTTSQYKILAAGIQFLTSFEENSIVYSEDIRKEEMQKKEDDTFIFKKRKRNSTIDQNEHEEPNLIKIMKTI